MLQVRITEYDGSDPIILENASNREYVKSVSSPDEGIKFELSKSDPKASYINPNDEKTYTRIWETWDTHTNKRLNYGPIDSIEDQGNVWRVTGKGRSAFLTDHFKTIKTFYSRIDTVIEELRYENIAIAPSTTVLVSNNDEDDTSDTILFPSDANNKYYNLSKKTKDFIIDDQTHYIPFNKLEPPRTFSTTKDFWSGTGTKDTVILDFGAPYDISKIKIVFPWWGGPQRTTNRTYDFTINYTNEAVDADPVWASTQDRNFQEPTKIVDSLELLGGQSKIVTVPARPIELYLGTTSSGYGTTLNSFNTMLDVTGPVTMRYLITTISGVNAWYGTNFDREQSHNGYRYQCDNTYLPGDDAYFGNKVGLMTEKKKNGTIKKKYFPDEEIKPSNDCHASIVELAAYKQIIEKKNIKSLAIQRIDNNNMQLTYYRIPDPSEMKKFTHEGRVYRKFEPGTFFRKFTIDWDNANNTYTKFYKDDCDDCYPDGFNFGIVDDDNSLIYRSDSASGNDIIIRGKQYTKHIITRGTADVQVTEVDCWKGKTDPLSWGGSYSYTERAGDYVTVHFRGESFKWYATVPQDKTGATVKIEYRYKAEGRRRGYYKLFEEYWSSWTTLEASYKIPNNITNYPVYEIPYGSGILAPETVYEIKITLLDDNFCSIDSIEGYWSGSFTEYNEDNTRITLSKPEAFTQIYNKKFTGGSMYKWNSSGASASLQFEGDRIIIQSAKGRNHGKLTLLLFQYDDGVVEYDPGVDNHIFIPGGSSVDGSLVVDLDTGKRGQEFPNYIIFDSNEYFGAGGLPWGKYTMNISYRPAETYSTTKYETGSDSFKYRCSSCNPKTGTARTINKYVYLDAIGVHERVGLSLSFDEKPHLDILTSVTDALQVEWDVAEDGLIVEPRLGSDTDIMLREGENTLVTYSIVNDFSKVATRLLSYGTSIDGIDLFTITEDKKSRDTFKRTITRQNDFRDIGSYNQLIGLSRMELKRRNRPEKRITVVHISDSLDLQHGDSFILWTKKSGNIRVRINTIRITETAGRKYTLECIEWPQIV